MFKQFHPAEGSTNLIWLNLKFHQWGQAPRIQRGGPFISMESLASFLTEPKKSLKGPAIERSRETAQLWPPLSVSVSSPVEPPSAAIVSEEHNRGFLICTYCGVACRWTAQFRVRPAEELLFALLPRRGDVTSSWTAGVSRAWVPVSIILQRDHSSHRTSSLSSVRQIARTRFHHSQTHFVSVILTWAINSHIWIHIWNLTVKSAGGLEPSCGMGTGTNIN